MSYISIIDYDAGNIDSIARAVVYCGGKANITKDPSDVEKCSHIILPGVGSFDRAYRQLEGTGLIPVIRQQVLEYSIPILGICLGMQLLATYGEEGEGSPGLDLVPGKVTRINISGNLKLPHVGWNDVHYETQGPLFDQIDNGKDFYFVHSYSFKCDDPRYILATATYSETVTAAVNRDMIFGVQFHPEKSQKFGLQLLKNFITI